MIRATLLVRHHKKKSCPRLHQVAAEIVWMCMRESTDRRSTRPNRSESTTSTPVQTRRPPGRETQFGLSRWDLPLGHRVPPPHDGPPPESTGGMMSAVRQSGFTSLFAADAGLANHKGDIASMAHILPMPPMALWRWRRAKDAAEERSESLPCRKAASSISSITSHDLKELGQEMKSVDFSADYNPDACLRNGIPGISAGYSIHLPASLKAPISFAWISHDRPKGHSNRLLECC